MTTTQRRRTRTERRAVALLLVVVTLTTATVLTISYLVSRENAPEIGQAAQDRVTGEWAARSAASLVEAAMETSAEWRSVATAADGMLLNDLKIMGSDVNVAVTNLEGEPVTDDDRQVLVTVGANAGGIETIIQRVVSETDPGDYDGALDPYLREFGVFAADNLTIESGSRFTPWPLSPDARAGGRVKLGVGFTSMSGLNGAGNAVHESVAAFLPPGASAGMQSAFNAQGVRTTDLPITPWTTTAEIPAAVSAVTNATALPTPVVIISDQALTGGRYRGAVSISSGAEVTLTEAESPYAFTANNALGDGLSVNGATLNISGNVVIAVSDTIGFNSAAITFDDDASLTIFHASDLTIADSVMNADPGLLGDAARSHRHLDEWTNPRRLRIVQLNDNVAMGAVNVTIDGRSIVVGNVHAPMAQVTIDGQSALAGRVSAGRLELRDNSYVLADPVFDNYLGLTEPDLSPLYDAASDPIAGLKAAMESTTGGEGAEAAKSRVMATLPAQPALDDAPDNGATKRHAGVVKRLREWPVRVRLLEGDGDVLFDAPRNETVADGVGQLVGQHRDDLVLAPDAGMLGDVVDSVLDILGL